MAGRSFVRSKAAGTFAIGAGLALIGWAVAGGIGLVAALLLSFLTAAWRHDNDLGTCFPLAMLLVLVIAILALLMALLGFLWMRH